MSHTPEQFMEYFRSNYPGPDTIISKPDWHAPQIYRAAIEASAFGDLLEACKLVDGIVKTLLDEACGKKATDWGVVNDGLLKISKAIAKASES